MQRLRGCAADLWHNGFGRKKSKLQKDRKERKKSLIQELNPSDYDFSTKQ